MIAIQNLIYNGATVANQSFSFCASAVDTAIAGNSGVTIIVTWICNLLYFVIKWFLLIVDIIFAYVRQLCGLEMDFSSLEAATSADSDLIFNLISSNSDTIFTIIRNLIGLAIILIIFFSIIAVIKSVYESTKTGNADFGSILRSAFKSFLFLVLTPFISVVGVIASNAFLKTLYNATDFEETTSLSSRIFMVSSTSANVFRIYAQNGQRIPIIYNFGASEQVLSYYKENSVTSEFIEFSTSENYNIYSTYLCFLNDSFYSYETLNDVLYSSSKTIEENVKDYYSIYDNRYGSSGDVNKRISSYMEEYYVMADVIDAAMKNANPIYYITIEELYDSLIDGGEDPDDYGITKSSGVISYSSTYLSIDDNGDATPMEITYNHVIGVTDEAEGAKYIVAIEKVIEVDEETTYSYYIPLTSNLSDESFGDFSSDYIKDGQIIAAKGIFDSGQYPTAIRRNSSGDIEFYRDQIDSIVVGVAGDMMALNWSSDGGIISSALKFLTAIFDPSSLVPDITVDGDAIASTYEANNEQIIEELPASKLSVTYVMNNNFLNAVTESVTGSVYGINISSLYNITKLNYMILIFGTALLVKICFSSILKLIGRVFELLLIITFYPMACATLPLDGGSYGRWMNAYVKRLFSTYGLILGINLVFILFPIIDEIEFFTVSDVESTKIVQRIGALFFSVFTAQQITNMMNFVVVIFFELVAFSLIDSAPQIVSSIVKNIIGDKGDDFDVSNEFAETVKRTSKVLAFPVTAAVTVAKVFNPKTYVNLAAKAGKGIVSSLPGSAIVREGMDKMFLAKQDAQLKELKQAQDVATKDAEKDPNDKEKQKAAQEAKEKYEKAQEQYLKAISNPTKARQDAEKKQREQAKKQAEQAGQQQKQQKQAKN